MQTLVVVSIRDIVANVFTPPQTALTTGHARRSFEDACKDKNQDLGRHPEHYELYELGTWTDTSGDFAMYDEKLQIAIGANYAG